MILILILNFVLGKVYHGALAPRQVYQVTHESANQKVVQFHVIA